MSYLQVTQLNKHYGQTQIFNNIDFSAKEGEFVTAENRHCCAV
jgi:putative spermidine/putrescine transport system ATP-binding protein